MIPLESFYIKSTIRKERLPLGEEDDLALYETKIILIPEGNADNEKVSVLTNNHGMYVKYKDDIYIVSHQVAFLRQFNNVMSKTKFFTDILLFSYKK